VQADPHLSLRPLGMITTPKGPSIGSFSAVIVDRSGDRASLWANLMKGYFTLAIYALASAALSFPAEELRLV